MPSSRVDKYEKRRKNTKRLSLLLILAIILVVVLLGFLIFGGGSESNDSNDHDTEQTSESSQSDTEKSSDAGKDEAEKDKADDNASSESDKEDDKENEELTRKKAEPSDDNVQKAYTADWKPVGTSQTGPHTTNYNEGSQDRQEMRKAVAVATDLNENDFIMWWAGRNGDQKVINTVSDPDENNFYRVYNKWVKNKGWQPTKVEKLKRNDIKQQ